MDALPFISSKTSLSCCNTCCMLHNIYLNSDCYIMRIYTGISSVNRKKDQLGTSDQKLTTTTMTVEKDFVKNVPKRTTKPTSQLILIVSRNTRAKCTRCLCQIQTGNTEHFLNNIKGHKINQEYEKGVDCEKRRGRRKLLLRVNFSCSYQVIW